MWFVMCVTVRSIRLGSVVAFNISLGYQSLKGQRARNEDFAGALVPKAFELDSKGIAAAVADGVSAGNGGRDAAQTTVHAVLEDYFCTPDTWETSVALDRILIAQNAWLYAQNRRRTDIHMATTLTAIVLRGHHYTVAHVGDTRAYLLREGALQQITTDHTYDHPDMTSALTRAVGVDERIYADYHQGELQQGDVFILLSDGISKVLKTKVMRQILSEAYVAGENPQTISEQLCHAALHNGSQDNVTALVIRVEDLPEQSLRDKLLRADALSVPRKLKLGEVLDDFAVTRLVADNGVNLVYQVRDQQSQQLYALKTLHPSRASDADERATLAHEAWLAQRLEGPHFVAAPKMKAGRQSQLYILYAWHSGHTLEQLLAQHVAQGQEFSVPEVLGLARELATIVAMLHRRRVIHRDIKPSNLHRGEDGVLRLLDLGSALSGKEPASIRQLHAGTPSYINPEQWDGEHADSQSDIYAACVTLYQLLTKQLPYGEVEPYQLARYKRDPSPPSKYRPDCPIWLQNLLLKGVARDKKQRFETAEELLLALERGAARPIQALTTSPLMHRDPTILWKMALGASLLFNFLLIYWALFLPR